MSNIDKFGAFLDGLTADAHQFGVDEQSATDQPIIDGLAAQIADLTARVAELETPPPVDPPPPTDPPVPPPVPPAAFPPAARTLFYGASEDTQVVLESQIGQSLGTDREYFQASQVQAMADYARAAASKGSLPIVSIKPPGTWADIAAGRQDAWVQSIVTALNAIGKPVLWTINHEPENDGPPAADFKAMCEHVNAMSTGNAWFGPVLMSGKYNPVPTPNDTLRLKVEDWCSPTSGRWMGFDAYNHYDPTSGKPWRSVPDTFSWMVNGGKKPGASTVYIKGFRDVTPGLPVVLCEYGVREKVGDPAAAAQWLTDAYDWCLANGVAGMSYFSSANNVNDGGATWKLDGPRLAAFKTLSGRATSVKLN